MCKLPPHTKVSAPSDSILIGDKNAVILSKEEEGTEAATLSKLMTDTLKLETKPLSLAMKQQTVVYEETSTSASSSSLTSSSPTLSSSASSDEKTDEQKQHDYSEEDDNNEQKAADDEDFDLENLLARDWQGKVPTAPLLRRQKRRQRQRANAKVGRALRRFVVSKGHRLSTYNQLVLDQAQREIVAYLDFVFGPLNLPNDTYLNTQILDPTYKSARVSSILHFDGIRRALLPLGVLEPELQLAIVVDSLRWSQALRCGPVCYPDGEIVFCFRVKPTNPSQAAAANMMMFQQSPSPSIMMAAAAAASLPFRTELVPLPAATSGATIIQPPMFLCVCGNCNQMIDARYGYCGVCGAVFE
jgi:hypothetical protein